MAANDARAEVKALQRKLANLSNCQPKRKRQKGTTDGEDIEVTAASEVKAVALFGRQFVIMNLVWFRPSSGPFGCQVDEEYNPVQRFENASSRLQGQLADLVDFLPKKFRDEYQKEWFTQTVSCYKPHTNSVPDMLPVYSFWIP